MIMIRPMKPKICARRNDMEKLFFYEYNKCFDGGFVGGMIFALNPPFNGYNK